MIGAQAGRYIAFDSTGIDFSITALFIVIMAVLVVYCFRNIDFQSTSHFLPALLAGALVAGLHFWKKNILLGIGMGTVCYMILIQLVFV